MPFRCEQCARLFDDQLAAENEFLCTRRCGGRLALVAALGLPDLTDCDFSRLPYPIALTAGRLTAALQVSSDVLKTLFLLKDCFEATIKYLGAVLLTDGLANPACSPPYKEELLKKMVTPSLGTWVNGVVEGLSRLLAGGDALPGTGFRPVCPCGDGKEKQAPGYAAFRACKEFVKYRNDALGHGAKRADQSMRPTCATGCRWSATLLAGVAGLAAGVSASSPTWTAARSGWAGSPEPPPNRAGSPATRRPFRPAGGPGGPAGRSATCSCSCAICPSPSQHASAPFL